MVEKLIKSEPVLDEWNQVLEWKVALHIEDQGKFVRMDGSQKMDEPLVQLIKFTEQEKEELKNRIIRDCKLIEDGKAALASKLNKARLSVDFDY